MIVHTRRGAVVVVSKCTATTGVYLAVGTSRGGSHGLIITPDELERLRAELERIAGELAEPAADQQPQQERGQ
jgi:hypothetical protein